MDEWCQVKDQAGGHELNATSAGTELDYSVQTWASGHGLECGLEWGRC